MDRSNVSIKLYMSELIFDVQNKTYLTGRSRQNGQNHEEVANMQANDDDENLNQLSRSIQNAWSALKTKLSEYVVSNQSSGDNELQDSEEELVITLAMPTNYNHATVDTITAAMHQYVVNIATGDWFTITNKNDANDYVTMAAANLEQVREALNKRVRPTRRAAGSSDSRFNTQTVATPTITTSNGSITISTSTTGATLHYTTDGSIPTTASAVYTGALTLAEGTVLRVMAARSGMYDSAVVTRTI